MPSFSVKPATPSDIPLIIQIQEKTWEPTYREILSAEQITYMFDKIYSYEALHSQMISEGQEFFILADDQDPVGFAAVARSESDAFKLHKIYVLPSTQGSGAGKFLLWHLESYVRAQGATKLYLNVNRYNKAKSFYEKMGFQVSGEENIPIGPYWMNDYVLEKAV